MNEYTEEAGSVTHEHILSHGFEVFESIKGNDMGQMEYEIPQFWRKSDGLRILGGYWGYKIKDKEGNTLIEDIWWNTNDEFDTTMKEIETGKTENKVDWFGFDKTKFTNAKELKDYEVGDEVLVFDMENYTQTITELPFKTKIIEKASSSLFVEFDGERLELYDYQVGEAL